MFRSQSKTTEADCLHVQVTNGAPLAATHANYVDETEEAYAIAKGLEPLSWHMHTKVTHKVVFMLTML